MLDTATAVYEAVEPIVVWRAMFATLDQIRPDAPLLSWVISSLPQQDNEVLALHIPVVLNHLLDQQVVSLAVASIITHVAERKCARRPKSSACC